MTRVIGAPRSRRRRWTFVLCLVAALGVGMLFVGGAQAVHNLGVFELDGNATNGAAAGDDWDNVCYDVLASAASCTAATGTTGSTASSWVSEPNRNTTIFTGGGSKDPQNLDQWAWKDGAGGLPDKDNLRHAFAVRYTATSANCGGALVSCDVIYFGSDRFDNSGDAQQGFWFLQNAVQTGCTIKIGGGTGFCDDSGTTAAAHKCGDLLVISDFANGGLHQIINVYKWVDSSAGCSGYPGDVATNLRLLGGTDPKTGNADCGVAPTNDAFCGTINSATITMPWSFVDKSLTANNQALQGEFFEAGVNLSSPQINLGGECFATVVSETRSSTSPTATLKDFIVGSFGKCTSGTTTEQNWLPNDTSTTTVTGKSSWSGTVNFTLFDGPDCGTTHGDGTAYVAGDLPLYQEDHDLATAGIQGVPVSNASPTASTTNGSTAAGHAAAVLVPSNPNLTQDAGTLNWSTSWLVEFHSGTGGVPDSSRCEATTLNINDNVSHT